MSKKFTSPVFYSMVLPLLASSTVRALPVGVGDLSWSDEFNGNSLDSSKWALLFPGGYWGDGINSSDAVSEGGGVLNLKAFTSGGVNYSAVLATQGLVSFKYGYFETRMQSNDAPGEWSAFWLNSPTNDGSILDDPAHAGTEMDVAEHRAVDSTGTDISSRINSAIHWNGFQANTQYVENLTPPLPGVGNNPSWHTYGMAWSPAGYTFYVDDQPTWTTTTAVSQTDEYLLLSTLIQNNTWAGTIPAGGYGSVNTSTTGVNIDYVRVYNLPEPAGLSTIVFFTAGLLGRGRREASTNEHE